MERARWKKTKMPIEADELPELYESNPSLSNSDFICIGCNGESIACSYKPENKRRPYFRVDQHDNNCDVFEYSELTKNGKVKRISGSDGFPTSYPSKLYLQDKNTNKATSEDIGTDNDGNIRVVNTYKGSDLGAVDTNHNRTSSTIRPIVKHFVFFPHDRDCKLELPMVKNQNTYNSIFRKISQYQLDDKDQEILKTNWSQKYSETKIYYGVFSLEKDSIVKKGKNLKIKLSLQNYGPIYLDIDTSKWSQRKYNEVVNELEDAKEERKNEFKTLLNKHITEYKVEHKIDKNEKLNEEIFENMYNNVKTFMNKKGLDIYIFFVGNLDKDNNKLFKLYNNDFRLYFAGFLEITYPKYTQ